MNLIEQTRRFVATQFQEHPHYSYNDWTVMYNHSLKVEEIARRIAAEVECDEVLVSLGALLHDIGKTYEADPKILHRGHVDFNLTVAATFISQLGLSQADQQALEQLISYQSTETEMKVIKDADALALYADRRLYMLFLEWAAEQGHVDSIQRKIDKFKRLNFNVSREIGQGWYETMIKDWKPVLEAVGIDVDYK